MMDDSFTDTMPETEKDAWNAFKEVVKKFLCNIKDPVYKEIVRNMLDNFKLLGCNMSRQKHEQKQHKTTILFTKQRLLVFNVGQIRFHVAY
jgi:hypothetical protein